MRSSHRLAAFSIAVALLTASAAGHAEPPAPAEPAPAPSEPAPEPTRGLERYRIEGRPEADGCGGRIVLAARILTLDRGRGTLFADVVDRTYRARFPGRRVVASGRFGGDIACHQGIDERWELAPSGPGELRGTLRSTWRIAPACQPCTVRFAIRAVRLR